MNINVFSVVILAALLADYILNLVVDWLNLEAAGEELPPEFEDVYDEERYAESQRYLKARTRCGRVSSTVSLVALLAFWWFGGFPFVERLVDGALPAGWDQMVIVRGLCYVAILFALNLAISLPFKIYRTFVIEARFGFNQTTARTFVMDTVKTLILSALLGGPLLAAVLGLFQYGGHWAWVYCWASTGVFMLFIQFIAPQWIMPLFNEFRTLENDELRESIEEYARKVNFPIEGVYEMDGSRRSTKSNAFMAGFGKNKKIALFDTLIDRHSVEELVGVIAHEVGHYKKHHIVKSLALGILEMGAMFFLLSVFIHAEGLYRAFGFESGSTPLYAGFVLFGLLYSPAQLLLSFFYNAFSRHNEREADAFAVETTGRPEVMADALKKLSRDNLSNLTPHPLAVFLRYSHPPVLDRIRRLENWG